MKRWKIDNKGLKIVFYRLDRVKIFSGIMSREFSHANEFACEDKHVAQPWLIAVENEKRARLRKFDEEISKRTHERDSTDRLETDELRTTSKFPEIRWRAGDREKSIFKCPTLNSCCMIKITSLKQLKGVFYESVADEYSISKINSE